MRRLWTAAALSAAATTRASATTTAPRAPPVVRIEASSTSGGGSKAFFAPPTTGAPAPAPPDLLWPLRGTTVGLDEDDDDEDDDDDDLFGGGFFDSDDRAVPKIKVRPYKRHWKVKLDRRPTATATADAWTQTAGPTVAVGLTVDAPVRTFVHTMAADDAEDEDKLVAKVVVRGDSRAVVDSVVDVVAVADTNYTAWFRVQQSAKASSATSGRLLVQILINTYAFNLGAVNATGSSDVVVLDDPSAGYGLMSVSAPRQFLASGHARLSLSLQHPVLASSLVLHAQDSSSLLLQSTASVVAAEMALAQRDLATLALVTRQLTTTSVRSTVRNDDHGPGGRLCVHTAAAVAAPFVSASVEGDGALLAWSSSAAASSSSGSSCQMVVVAVRGRKSRADVRAVPCRVANATVVGDDSAAVVDARQQLIYSASAGASVAVVNEPWVEFGDGELHVERESVETPLSPCALQRLAEQFPLPTELAVPIVAQSPIDDEVQPTPLTQPPPLNQPEQAATEAAGSEKALEPLAAMPSVTSAAGSNSSEESPERKFVNGSLHMLGSLPYMDAIVVFFASAWILHHLLQCYDRRQRRRNYSPLNERDQTDDDRVWV